VLNKKTSNILSVLVALWTLTLIAVSIFRSASEGAVIDLLGAGVAGLAGLTPLLLIFVNSRRQTLQISFLDQALQVVFFILWLALGLSFSLEGGLTTVFILVAALLLLLIIVSKSIFDNRTLIAGSGLVRGKAARSNKKVLLLVLNTLTIWLPLAFAVSFTAYIAVRYPNEPDSGLALIPIYIGVGPFLIAGIVVAIITLIWQLRTLLKKRHSLSRVILIWGSVWGLSSVAYLAIWVWSLFQLSEAFRNN
jgi:hypothetical protein